MEKFIVGNWKMNLGDDTGIELAQKLGQIKLSPDTTVIIAPPFTVLGYAQEALLESNLFVGAQDCSAHENGAYTGEVSAHMLKMMGCNAVIVGHSERRHYHGEASETVCKKAEKACEMGLLPIICVGETLSEYEEQKTLPVLREQIERSVPKQDAPFLLAYEPVWSIGTGKVPQIDEIKHVADYIQGLFESIPPILYGGSVSPENVSDILKIENVNGVLVGGASINFEKFEKILSNVEKI